MLAWEKTTKLLCLSPSKHARVAIYVVKCHISSPLKYTKQKFIRKEKLRDEDYSHAFVAGGGSLLNTAAIYISLYSHPPHNSWNSPACSLSTKGLGILLLPLSLKKKEKIMILRTANISLHDFLPQKVWRVCHIEGFSSRYREYKNLKSCRCKIELLSFFKKKDLQNRHGSSLKTT